MKRTLLLLMAVMLGVSMSAQVFRTGDRLPRPSLVRPQSSTDLFSRRPVVESTPKLQVQTPKRKETNISVPEINEYWGATRSSWWEIGANFHYLKFDPHTYYDEIRESEIPGLNVDWIHSFTGTFGTAVIPYFGFGIFGGYELEHDAFAGSASGNLGIMFGKKRFKFDLRVQPSLTYCSDFKYYDGFYINGYGYYMDWHHNDFLGFTMNVSAGIYYGKVHLRALYYLIGTEFGAGLRLGVNL